MSKTAMTQQSTGQLSEVERTVKSINEIRSFVADSLIDEVDYGVIPGTGDGGICPHCKGRKEQPPCQSCKGTGKVPKKTLYLSGAQKILLYFNVRPEFLVTKTPLEGNHVEIDVKTVLYSRMTGEKVGEGLGSCSTMESKYRYRNGQRKCPLCTKETIRKSKEPQTGYYCWAKIGGCGVTFRDGTPEIESQVVGKVENADIADVRNTVLKISKKRSFVDSAITLSCLSSFNFTQDMEENEHGLEESPRKQQTQSPQETSQSEEAELAAQQQEWATQIDATEHVEQFNALAMQADQIPNQILRAQVKDHVRVVVKTRGYLWDTINRIFHAPKANGTPQTEATPAQKWLARLKAIEDTSQQFLVDLTAFSKDLIATKDRDLAKAVWPRVAEDGKTAGAEWSHKHTAWILMEKAGAA